MGRTILNRTALRHAVGALLLILLAGCESGVDVATEDPEEVPTESTAPGATQVPKTTEATQTTSASPDVDSIEPEFGNTPFGLAHDAVAERFERPEADPGAPQPSPEFVTLREHVGFTQAISAGRRVTIIFQGPPPTTSDGYCTIDHRVEVEEETDQAVTLSLMRITVLSPGATLNECPNDEQTWAMTTRVQEPFGNRRLRSSLGWEIQTIREEARLSPTELPDGWVTSFDNETLPTRTVKFESADDEWIVLKTGFDGQLATLSSYYSVGEAHRSESIRRDTDGMSFVRNGRPVVAFVEQGWLYELVGHPDLDVEVLLEVARSFERPALLDSEVGAEFIPATTTPPQPGQEEFEARALQGVLEE